LSTGSAYDSECCRQSKAKIPLETGKGVAEPTWHDNKCKDADQARPVQGELDYEERVKISVQDAVQWANDLPYWVTLYLYEAEEA
jgi:hypothetical protein